MLKKEEAIELLNKALAIEENIISIYYEHMSSSVFWTGLSGDKVDKVKVMLKNLHDESISHKAVVESMIKKIREADKHAF